MIRGYAFRACQRKVADRLAELLMGGLVSNFAEVCPPVSVIGLSLPQIAQF